MMEALPPPPPVALPIVTPPFGFLFVLRSFSLPLDFAGVFFFAGDILFSGCDVFGWAPYPRLAGNQSQNNLNGELRCQDSVILYPKMVNVFAPMTCKIHNLFYISI